VDLVVVDVVLGSVLEVVVNFVVEIIGSSVVVAAYDNKIDRTKVNRISRISMLPKLEMNLL